MLASCFTFFPPDEVPVGISYRVNQICLFLFNILVTSYMTYYMSNSQTRFKINTGWKGEDDTDIDYIRMYVHNENQGLKTFRLKTMSLSSLTN